MKTLQIIAAVLIATTTVSSAQFVMPTLPQREGTIQEMWTQPAPPTTASPVMLYVRMNHRLQFDKSETQATLHMITVKLYWKASAIGGIGPGSQQSVSLGALPAGRYTVHVQSFYEGRFADMEHLSFQVTKSDGPPNGCIEEVYIVPENPTTSGPVTLHVKGTWPTSGYRQIGWVKSTINNQITVSMYWTSPTGQVLQVETPYHKTTSLGPLLEGTAHLVVRCYLDNVSKATEILTFEVAPGTGGWPWDGWPF